MVLPGEVYESVGVDKDLCLATIPDFNSLIAIAQSVHTPIFAVTPEQLGQSGVVLEQTMNSRDNFERLFSDFADKVIELTTHEASA